MHYSNDLKVKWDSGLARARTREDLTLWVFFFLLSVLQVSHDFAINFNPDDDECEGESKMRLSWVNYSERNFFHLGEKFRIDGLKWFFELFRFLNHFVWILRESHLQRAKLTSFSRAFSKPLFTVRSREKQKGSLFYLFFFACGFFFLHLWL